jgi:acyl dehydratase
MTTVVSRPADLLELVDHDLGTSDWLTVPQADVDVFARVARDEQWIHVDPERARTGPFGVPIVHGYLTLALIVPLLDQILQVENCGISINYGLNRVRFPAPLPAGSRIRMTGRIAQAAAIAGGVHLVCDSTVVRDGGDKPVCVAQSVFRFYD